MALKAEEKRKAETEEKRRAKLALNAPPPAAPGAQPAPASGKANRNGYDDDDGSDDLRNAGEVEEYAYVDG